MTTGRTTEPRLSKRELFAALGYEPHPGQLAVHKSQASRRVLSCGVRWGKTTCATMEAIAFIMAPAKSSRGWIAAPFHELSDRTFKRVAETIKHAFPHRVIEYSPREHRLVVMNFGGGISEVRGKSADNSTSLLGESLDWLVLDEATRMPGSIWHSHLSQRLVDRKGRALIISTPRGCDWFYDVWKRGQKGRDSNYESWSSPSITNPHLDAATIEAERGTLTVDVFRQEYEACFLGSENEPCDTCHGPKENARHFLLMVDGLEPKRCPQCNEYVNDDGETAVNLSADGTRRSVVIIHCEDSPDPSTVPPIAELPDYVDAIVLHKPGENREELPPGVE